MLPSAAQASNLEKGPHSLSHLRNLPRTDYTVSNPPPKDSEGNYSLKGNDTWAITGHAQFFGNISLQENSALSIENANLTLNGTIWVSGNATVEIANSENVTISLPPARPVPAEKYYEKPDGYVYVEEGSSLSIANSYVHLFRFDPEVPIPSGWELPRETLATFGDFLVKNSEINTWGSAVKGGTLFDVHRPIIAQRNSYVSVQDSILFAVIFEVDASGDIMRSRIDSIPVTNLNNESAVRVLDSIIGAISINACSNAMFSNSTLGPMMMKDKAEVVVKKCTISDIGQFGSSTMMADQSNCINPSPMSPFGEIHDSSELVITNSSLFDTLVLYDNSSLYSSTSTIDNLSATDNSIIKLHHSVTKHLKLDGNATLFSLSLLKVITTLNEMSISLPVQIYDPWSSTSLTAFSDESGIAETALVRRIENNSAKQVFWNSTISATFHNLHMRAEQALMENYTNVTLDFIDKEPPVIRIVRQEFDEGSDNLVVTADIQDDVNGAGLANVTLMYSQDESSVWVPVLMHPLGDNLFEVSLQKQQRSSHVRFKIIAYDFCGNRAESDERIYVYGGTFPFLSVLFLVLLLGLCPAAIALYSRRRKIRRWKKSTIKSDESRCKKNRMRRSSNLKFGGTDSVKR